MMSTIWDKLKSILLVKPGGSWGYFHELTIFLLLVAPIAIFGVVTINQVNDIITDNIIAEKEAKAQLLANMFDSRVSSAKNFLGSLARRENFQALVATGQWEDAAVIMGGILQEFGPVVERMILVDPDGILKADHPAISEVRGQDFSFRDWYKGVSRNWTPYVSKIYQRTAPPQHNVVMVAAPIYSPNNSDVIGILLLQSRVENFFSWIKEVSSIGDSVVYFVDPEGNVVGHPGIDPQGDITNLSQVTYIQKVLSGDSGATYTLDPFSKLEHLIVYEPVQDYNWGVVISENVDTTFAARNSTLYYLSLALAFVLLFALFVAYLIIRLVHKEIKIRKTLSKQSEELEEKVHQRTKELDEKIEELEQLNKIMVGRELKMIELKKELKNLKNNEK